MNHQQVENVIVEAIKSELTPHLEKLYKHEYFCPSGGVDVKCQQTDDPLTRTLVLRVLFDHEHKNIQIPNIFMPKSMSHQGIGKRTLQRIFDVAKPLGYDLYITELVDGFKKRLLSRGAVLVEQDVVKITDQTELRIGR